MLHTWYYLIEPRTDAAARLRGRDPDLVDLLLEPNLISNVEADRSWLGAEEHLLRVKILYLARLREYTPFASDEDARSWFGCDRVSGNVFDEWWTIRRFGLDHTDAELVDFLKPLKAKVLPTGNELVDRWLGKVL
jgi:hypothetical protein